jgi:hypothetical protein
VISLVLLGVAGFFVGGAISAARNGAPTRTVRLLLALGGVAVVIAVVSFF